MRVGFLNPGYEHLGLEYLSASLRRAGHTTQLFLDPILFNESGFIQRPLLAKWFSFEKHIIRSIQEYQPDLLCLSVLSDNYQWACSWAETINSVYSVPIVIGGIHPSSVPDHVIQNQWIDYLCVGEGEEALVDLVRCLEAKQNPSRIKNIWTVQAGQVHRNEVRPLISDINTLPYPDKALFYSQLPALKRIYSISTSRGCPFTCSYCCNNVWKSIYRARKSLLRRRSVANVIDELSDAKRRYVPKSIAFLDEVFNMEKEWLLDFFKEYRAKIDLPFSCFVFPDYLDEEIILELKKSGCIKVQMGVQLIDEEKRNRLLNRRSSNAKIQTAIALCKQTGIFVACDVIWGLPDTTEADLFQAVDFFCQTTPDHIEIFWLRYYPKTSLTEWARKNGYLTAADYQAINEGVVSTGIVRGKNKATKLEKKIFVLLYLWPLLPEKLRMYLAKKSFYRFLPAGVSILALYILKRLVKRSRYDINTEQTMSRYVYFMFLKFKLKVKLQR
ncbi:MAG: B12-binding domain-containing radical SAM protein [Candidatus Omnitrophica bacterium]|nr:B12-binding domain-containing radical SAM protein [Candidatus Omnitrophota bacterium]